MHLRCGGIYIIDLQREKDAGAVDTAAYIVHGGRHREHSTATLLFYRKMQRAYREHLTTKSTKDTKAQSNSESTQDSFPWGEHGAATKARTASQSNRSRHMQLFYLTVRPQDWSKSFCTKSRHLRFCKHWCGLKCRSLHP